MNQPNRLTTVQKEWVEQTLSTLSVHEKIGQTIQEVCPHLASNDPSYCEEYFASNPLGSVFCGGEIIKGAGSSSSAIRENLEGFQKACKVPLLVAGDLEYGAGAAVEDLTIFPTQMALGAAKDESLAYEYGKYTAMEGRTAGFNWTFSPVADLLKNWQNPVISTRAVGDKPEPVARIISAIIRGLQDNGVAACAKHFPGDGVDFRDQHLLTTVNSLSEADWWANHGKVFQTAIDSGVHSIMPGHIALEWLEPIGNCRPRPATVSKRILTDLLRNRMGFQGVIVSDALIMAGFTGWARREQRLIEAFNAGIDMLLWPGKNYFELMERSLEEGRVSEQRLDESVRRILTLKAKLGLPDSKPATPLQGNATRISQIHAEAQHLADKIARESVTLIRNRKHLLPLDPAKIKRVLVHKAVPTGLAPKSLVHMEQMIDLLKARGLELTILENGNCLDLTRLEAEGNRWDAYLVLYSIQSHQIKNSARPAGDMAEVIWTQQTGEYIAPITISLGTPFLLHDMPFLDTLVNAYATSPSTIKALDQALFGEIPFSTSSPVDLHAESWFISNP